MSAITPQPILMLNDTKPGPVKMTTWQCDVMSLYFVLSSIEFAYTKQNKRFSRPIEAGFLIPCHSDIHARKLAASWYVRDINLYIVHVFIDKSFLTKYQTQFVGLDGQKEYWVPLVHLDKLNDALRSDIEVVGVVKR